LLFDFFFERFLQICLWWYPFKKIDLDLGAVIIDAELTRLDVNCFGVEVQGRFLGIADVATCVARMCHELGAVDLGAKPDANYYGAEL